jgi:Protein of unknown function (DUF2752)
VISPIAADTRPRPRLEVTVGAAAVLLLAVLTGLVDPSHPGNYPVCPVHALTGLACPGCGSLRAMHDLAHGHILAALDHNALFVVVLAMTAGLAARVLAGRPRLRTPPSIVRVAVVLLVAWTVARNLPVDPFSVLAP